MILTCELPATKVHANVTYKVSPLKKLLYKIILKDFIDEIFKSITSEFITERHFAFPNGKDYYAKFEVYKQCEVIVIDFKGIYDSEGYQLFDENRIGQFYTSLAPRIKDMLKRRK